MPRLNGIVIPLPTPFTDSGEVDHDGIRELTRFYLNAGVHGLFALGTFGQGPALSPDERKEIARVVLETVGGMRRHAHNYSTGKRRSGKGSPGRSRGPPLLF